MAATPSLRSSSSSIDRSTSCCSAGWIRKARCYTHLTSFIVILVSILGLWLTHKIAQSIDEAPCRQATQEFSECMKSKNWYEEIFFRPCSTEEKAKYDACYLSNMCFNAYPAFGGIILVTLIIWRGLSVFFNECDKTL